jgi:molybdopterin-guanine dinucleotide biosynthesis protein A
LEIEGISIIKRQLEILRPIFDKIIIVTNSPQAYQDLDAALVSDIILGKGPLGGIYSALKQSDTLYNFIVASDMPCLNSLLIRYMSSKISGYDAVVPESGGRLEPLHAFYAKACLSVIENQLKNDNLKIIDFFPQVRVKKIGKEELSQFDPKQLSFVNINTLKDYEKVKW